MQTFPFVFTCIRFLIHVHVSNSKSNTTYMQNSIVLSVNFLLECSPLFSLQYTYLYRTITLCLKIIQRLFHDSISGIMMCCVYFLVILYLLLYRCMPLLLMNVYMFWVRSWKECVMLMSMIALKKKVVDIEVIKQILNKHEFWIEKKNQLVNWSLIFWFMVLIYYFFLAWYGILQYIIESHSACTCFCWCFMDS